MLSPAGGYVRGIRGVLWCGGDSGSRHLSGQNAGDRKLIAVECAEIRRGDCCSTPGWSLPDSRAVLTTRYSVAQTPFERGKCAAFECRFLVEGKMKHCFIE